MKGKQAAQSQNRNGNRKRKETGMVFGVLFLKECRQVLKSLVYYIYVVVFVVFISGQMSSEGLKELQEPAPGQADYGETITHDETLIMKGTVENLAREVNSNSFVTYPMGFYKGVNLTDSESAQAKEILKRCVGENGDSLKDDLTYEEFEAAMAEICQLVGRGSFYEKESYENRIYAPMTYEQPKAEFDALCGRDRVTRAWMRLFCDYAGIVLAVLPIFIGVSGALRDKRAKAQQVIFSRPVSGLRIVAGRYLANLVMLVIPVAITAFVLHQPCYEKAQAFGVQGDRWAFLTVTGVWLLPEIMAVLALSFLITELTGTVLAVFVQAAWGIGSIFGADTLVGDFGLKLVARWNTLGQTELFALNQEAFLINRGYYFLLALICVILTAIVFERKRGGKLLWKNI